MSECKNCGAELTWDETKVSKRGKMIPLESDGTPHKCPNSTFKKSQNTDWYWNPKPTVIAGDLADTQNQGKTYIYYNKDDHELHTSKSTPPEGWFKEKPSLLTKGSKKVII